MVLLAVGVADSKKKSVGLLLLGEKQDSKAAGAKISGRTVL